MAPPSEALTVNVIVSAVLLAIVYSPVVQLVPDKYTLWSVSVIPVNEPVEVITLGLASVPVASLARTLATLYPLAPAKTARAVEGSFV